MAGKKAKNPRKEIAKKLDQEVGTRLENIRKGKLHMTQEQLGEIIDRSVPTVRRYENGLSRVPDEIKVVLNNKLGIKPDDLLLNESEIRFAVISRPGNCVARASEWTAVSKHGNHGEPYLEYNRKAYET